MTRLFICLALLSACSEYRLSAEIAGSGAPDEEDGTTVDPRSDLDDDTDVPAPRTCEADATVIQATFDAREIVGCPFGIDDNLDRRNEFNQARTIERWEVPVPPGATLCAVALTSVEDRLYFDDHITLVLDDAVLVGGGSGYAMDLLEVRDGIPRWDWQRVVGAPFPPRDTPYTCLGGAEPCEVPQTEQPGPLELTFDDAILRDLLDPDRAHELTLLTFGDDNDTDCAHSAFTLEVTLEVLE